MGNYNSTGIPVDPPPVTNYANNGEFEQSMGRAYEAKEITYDQYISKRVDEDLRIKAAMDAGENPYPLGTNQQPEYGVLAPSNNFPFLLQQYPNTTFPRPGQTGVYGVPDDNTEYSAKTYPTLPETPPKILSNQPTSYGSDYDAYLKNKQDTQRTEIPNGLYTDAEIAQGLDQKTYDPKTGTRTDQQGGGANKDQARLNAMMRYMNPGGSNLSTELFTLGRGLGAEKGTKGKWADIIGGAGAGLFDIARNVASGIGYSKMNDYTQNYYDDLMKEKKYTNISQTDNTNNVGYTPYARDGGKFFFAEDGGEMPQEGAQPQDQMVQVAQQLVEGLGSLEAIDAYLKEQGTDEQSYQAIMQIAEQMLGENSAPGQEQPEAQEQPQMKGGGTFTHKVGDFLEFEHDGKTHSGRISKIENGQIFL
jgi:hypothetical protein